MDRTDPSTVTDAPVDREEPAAGLTVSIARRYANRSGDTDLYVRFVERDGILYRVALRSWGDRAGVRAWIAAFLDAPFAIAGGDIGSDRVRATTSERTFVLRTATAPSASAESDAQQSAAGDRIPVP
jgi:hypothetical protein